MELWKPVLGYEGIYEVSNTGKVRSLDRYTTGNRNRLLKGKILKNRLNDLNYCTVSLCINGKPKSARVHRLVAKAFLPNPENKPYVNHIDGDPTNNAVSNLEWCTQAENIQHAYRTGLFSLRPKLKKEQIEYIKEKYEPYRYSAQKIADELGVNIMTVYNVLHKKQRYLKE